MADTPFIGKIFFERGNSDSPTSFTRVCQVFGISGFGESNSLEDVTTFCSGGNREYIGGLADGSEFTIEANYEQATSPLTSMITDVKTKTAREYRLVIEQASPSETMTFHAVPMSWELGPSVDAKNTISFTFKISGEVVIGTSA